MAESAEEREKRLRIEALDLSLKGRLTEATIIKAINDAYQDDEEIPTE